MHVHACGNGPGDYKVRRGEDHDIVLTHVCMADWAKGHGRRGDALFFKGRFMEAVAACAHTRFALHFVSSAV